MKYKVQQEIAKRKKSFYKSKVKYLKKDDCHKWWNIINQMSGRSAKPSLFFYWNATEKSCANKNLLIV